MATIKQQEAAKALVGTGGNVTKAMRKAKYSENTINTPQKLTTSKGWIELMKEHLPDKELAINHKELLNQKRIEYFTFSKNMSDEEITKDVESAGLKVIVIQESQKGKLAFYSIPDAMAKKSALEMAYKLKGYNAPEKSVNLTVGLNDITNEDITRGQKFDEWLKKQL